MRFAIVILLVLGLGGWMLHLTTPDGPPGKLGSTVKVAAIQCPSRLGDVQYNRAHLTRLIERANENGAQIVVLPETAITG